MRIALLDDDPKENENLRTLIDAYAAAHNFEAVVPISAKKGKYVDELMQECGKFLHEDDWIFEEDMITDQTQRTLAAEIIRDGVNGYLCENEPKDLARVIAGAMDDPERRGRIGAAARETIPVPWSKVLETAAERYERLVALGKEGKLKDKRRRLV